MTTTTSITFVTAFFKIYEEPPLKERTIDWRMIYFEQLAKTNIPLVIYTCKEYLPLLAPYLETCPNLRIGRIMDFKDTDTWRTVSSLEVLSLPEKRCVTKDTKEYIALMNAKTEFMKYAVDDNVLGSTHFAWVDFNIFHIFKGNPGYAAKTLEVMSQRALQMEDFLVVPGCWDYNWTNEWSIPNEVCWRFCGGFFMGTEAAVLQFHSLYETWFLQFLQKFGVLTWEVNFWSWLELNKYFAPIWYKGDHNVSILEFSADVCCVGLPITKSVRYNYPDIGPNFVPTSVAYLHDTSSLVSRDILNVRFVNYIIQPNGCYIIHDPQSHLYTRNMSAVLLDDDSIDEMKEMLVEEDELVNYGGKYYGLEDVRLYQLAGESTVRFVCSNSNHIPNLKIRIMSGIYDLDNGLCRDMRILHPPTDTYCEKNWIPLPSAPSEFADAGGEYFIYRWMPFEIGRLDDTDQLRIVKTYSHNTPFWRNVRGSSCLQETEDGYLCVAHFSEEKHPRHYFHLLVLLEKGTYKPLKYSRFFYFHKKSIEFCIGFCKKERTYCFWISNFDRDPEYLEVDCDSVELCYDIA